MIRVLVLADSAVVRAGLEAMLRENGRFDAVRADIPLADLTRVASLRSGSQPDAGYRSGGRRSQPPRPR